MTLKPERFTYLQTMVITPHRIWTRRAIQDLLSTDRADVVGCAEAWPRNSIADVPPIEPTSQTLLTLAPTTPLGTVTQRSVT